MLLDSVKICLTLRIVPPVQIIQGTCAAMDSRSASHLEPSIGVPLGSDLAEVHPNRDAFGYKAFAQAIARAALTTPSPAGLVMAIDGPWGAGKTTLLNFVKHYLTDCDSGLAELSIEERPVIVKFNPWWFADGEQLARQFLTQFAAQIPVDTGARLDSIRTAVANYSDALGEAASWTLTAKTGIKSKLVRDIVVAVLRNLAPREKDIAALKKVTADALLRVQGRFVVIVDDIDRLRPKEINEVFRVIKALADFPNVIYLLAYDGSVVSQALESEMGIRDGRAYMEKIVQAQFSLPVVARTKLLRKLSDDLDSLLARIGATEVDFDNERWTNISEGGLDRLFRRPRDIVRIINALSVTLKPLLGEVNIVDFIALEFLRIFTPSAYRAIRDNEEKFVGKSSRDPDREGERRFHEEWLSEVSSEQQDAVRNVIKRLFPRLQSVWGNVVFDASEVRKWSAEARASAPDHYPKYFEFSVPENTLSRAELRAVISLGDNPDALENRWRAAMDERREDGETKADDLIGALVERDDLPPDFARACLEAVFRLADEFLADPANRRQGFFAPRPYVRLYWLANHLVGRLPEDTHENDFLELVRASSSVTWLGHLATSIQTMHGPDAERRNSRFQGFSAATVTEIVQIALTRIRDAARRRTLLLDPDLVFFLHRWIEWGDAKEVRAWVQAIVNNDAELLLLLKRIIRVSTVQNVSDAFARQVESINPDDLQDFIDVSAPEFISRITALGARVDLLADDRQAISLFEQGVKRASERS